MKKYHEISKYLITNEFNFIKRRNKSKSPLYKKSEIFPISNFEKYSRGFLDSKFNEDDNILSPFINDNNPFLIESKINLDDNPFLSNINKNQNFSMHFRKRITLNSNISKLLENEFEQTFNVYDNNISLFSNSLTNTNNLYNDEISNSFSSSNFNIYFDKKVNESNENKSSLKIIKEYKKENNNNSIIKNTLSEKEKIVIEALITLDKDYNKNEIDKDNNSKININENELEEYNFTKLFKIFSNSSEEEIVEYEKKKYIFEFIDKRIKKYYNYYKKNKTYRLNESQIELDNFDKEIDNILLLEEKDEKYLFFCFKSVVLGINNIIKYWLSNSYFKNHLKKIKEKNTSFHNNNINLDIFIELMDKYNIIKDICQYLEKDFKKIIDNFQRKNKIKFCLCELLTDLYWDYLFKIHFINIIFTKGYYLNNIKNNVIFEEAKLSMKNIIDILIVYDTTYKKNIGEILNLPYIKKENIFLMSYIIKFKTNANPFEIKKLYLEQCNGNNKNNSKNCENYNKNKKSIENKNTDNFSLEDFYKYIQEDNENKKGKKKNKKRQKKKKNKKENIYDNENDNINNLNDSNYEVDPIVEEFIQYFIEFNKNNIKCVKIKPVLSQEWIKSIS